MRVPPPELVEYLITRSLAGAGGYVMTPNLDNLRRLKTGPAPYEARTRGGRSCRRRNAFDLGGVGIMRARRSRRRAGPRLRDLMLADATVSIWPAPLLLGGEPGTAERAGAASLRNQDRGYVLSLVRLRRRDPDEMARIRTHVSAARPIPYTWLPFPKARTS